MKTRRMTTNTTNTMIAMVALALAFCLPMDLEAKPGKKGKHGKKGVATVVVAKAKHGKGHGKHAHSPRVRHGKKHLRVYDGPVVVYKGQRARLAAKRAALRAAIRDTRDRIAHKEYRLAELRSVPRNPYVRARMQRLRRKLSVLYAELDELRFRLDRQRRIAHRGHGHWGHDHRWH